MKTSPPLSRASSKALHKKVSLRGVFTLDNIKRALQESTEDQIKILKKYKVL
jgi:hypothetical protein